MPNGGSDCCGTCWFNARNRGEAGYGHAGNTEPAVCTIRNLAIEDPFYTYCANHPHRRPDRDSVPIGPVFTGDSDGGREVWQPSPDTEEVRRHLLDLLAAITEAPTREYPIGPFSHEVVIWQIGEFRDRRAIVELRRIAGMGPADSIDPFCPNRPSLTRLALDALRKIEPEGP